MKIGKRDMYPPPQLPELVNLGLDELKQRLAEEEDREELWWAVASLLLRKGEVEESISHFEEALARGAIDARLRSNLGLAFLAAEKPREARAQFKQAILSDASLVLPHVHLARYYRAQDDIEQCKQQASKALANDGDCVEAHILLAEIAEESGDFEEAKVRYERVYALRPKLAKVRNKLARFGFKRGQALFSTGEIFEALKVWSDTFSQYSRSFSADRSIANDLHVIVRDFEPRFIDREMSLFANKLNDEKDAPTPADYTRIMQLFLFSIGLFPELYINVDALEEETKRWSDEANGELYNPYAGFRLGLVLTCSGRTQEAIDEILKAQDSLTPSKQSPLKIDKVASFVRRISEMERKAARESGSDAPLDEWEYWGFDDPFQREAWQKSNVSPEQASLWRKADFTAAQTRSWTKERVSLEVAKKWRGQGIDDPKVVKIWSRAQFEPDEASEWSKFFADDIEKAIQAKNAGFDSPEEAAKWLAIFMFPGDAIRWRELGFSTRDAAVYVRGGTSDPHRALEMEKTKRENVQATETKEEKE